MRQGVKRRDRSVGSDTQPFQFAVEVAAQHTPISSDAAHQDMAQLAHKSAHQVFVPLLHTYLFPLTR